MRIIIYRVPLLLLSITFLSACATPLTYTQVAATASITQCWPGRFPTPPPITVTPFGTPTPSPAGTPTTIPIIEAGTPTATRAPTETSLPTTTPMPLCPPEPGETVTPFPTPVPPAPPFPTMKPTRRTGGLGIQTTLLLPNELLTLSIATHPTDEWLALATVEYPGLTDRPRQVFARVLNPTTHEWSMATQVDVGNAGVGVDRFARAVIGIAGDNTVSVVWGGSDDTGTIWTSSSIDYGTRWSPPQAIATNCWEPKALATTPSGQIAVMATCYKIASPANIPLPTVILRDANGMWMPQIVLNETTWYGADEAVTITGDGADARVIALFATEERKLATATKYFARAEPWKIVVHPAVAPGQANGGAVDHLQARPWNSIAPNGSIRHGVTFAWSVTPDDSRGLVGNGIYALTSADNGTTWSAPETVMAFPASDSRRIPWVTIGFDPAAQYLVGVWTCCNGNFWDISGSTHYTSVRSLDTRAWNTASIPFEALVPLVSGARAAQLSVSAQAEGSRMLWLAWVDRQHYLEVRTLDLNQIVPVSAYPTSTP